VQDLGCTSNGFLCGKAYIELYVIFIFLVRDQVKSRLFVSVRTWLFSYFHYLEEQYLVMFQIM